MILVPTDPLMLTQMSKIISHGDRMEFNRNRIGADLKATLEGSINETSMSIIHDGNLLATGGSGTCLWFVTSQFVALLTPTERLQMLELLKGHLEVCRKRQPAHTLSNYVWEGNKAHIRLLKHLGATFADEPITTPAGFPFYQFWL